MIDFIKKHYIIFSIIPVTNGFLAAFTLFYCIITSEFKKKMPIIILESALILIVVYPLPQKIMIYFEVYGGAISFINISFAYFIMDMNLRRIITKQQKSTLK